MPSLRVLTLIAVLGVAPQPPHGIPQRYDDALTAGARTSVSLVIGASTIRVRCGDGAR